VAFWKAARLETTPKLFALTFLMVAYGGNDLTSCARRAPLPCAPPAPACTPACHLVSVHVHAAAACCAMPTPRCRFAALLWHALVRPMLPRLHMHRDRELCKPSRGCGMHGQRRPSLHCTAQELCRLSRGCCMHTCAGDLEAMVSRIAGILAGIVVSLALAVTVYPKSATQARHVTTRRAPLLRPTLHACTLLLLENMQCAPRSLRLSLPSCCIHASRRRIWLGQSKGRQLLPLGLAEAGA
jgi:hypothetical protein